MRLLKIATFGAAVLLSGLAAREASATCADGVGVTASASIESLTYDPLAVGSSTVASVVSVTNATGANCQIRVTWSRNGGASNWNPVNGLNSVAIASIASTVNGATSQNEGIGNGAKQRVFTVNNGTTATFRLVATINPAQYVSPLAYTRAILALVESRVPATNPYVTVAAGLPTSFDVTVQKAVNFNFVGTNTTFGGGDASQNYSVNFGDMTTGEASNIFIQFRGNASVSTNFVSTNGGVLKHTNNITTVPYTFVVNGTTLVNATGSPPSMAANTGSGGVATYPIGITLGNVNGLFAGSYSDTITVTITPL